MTELSTETYILHNKTIIRGRNVLVQKDPWINVLAAKRLGPKRPVDKRPRCETSWSKTAGGEPSWTKNVRLRNDQVRNVR